MEHVTENKLGRCTSDTTNVRGIADALSDRKESMPVGENVKIGGKKSTKVAKDVEVFAFHDAIGLRTVGNRKVSRDVEDVAEGSHYVTREVGGVVATQVESSAITTEDSEKSFRCRLSRVVDGRDQFHVRSETANDDEYVDMSAARGRERTESVDCNSDEGFVGLGGCEFWDGDCRPRLILLTMSAGLNEIHDVRFDAVPGVTIQPKKLEGYVYAVVTHEMIVVVAENDQLVGSYGEG